MPATFHLSVVAPDKSVVEVEVNSVIAPGELGYIGALAGHSPLITALKPGLLEYVDVTGNRHYVYIGGGFAEIRADKVTVLADEAARAQDIDVAKAEAALEEARKTLRGEGTGVTTEQSTREIERAMNRLRAARTGR